MWHADKEINMEVIFAVIDTTLKQQWKEGLKKIQACTVF